MFFFLQYWYFHITHTNVLFLSWPIFPYQVTLFWSLNPWLYRRGRGLYSRQTFWWLQTVEANQLSSSTLWLSLLNMDTCTWSSTQESLCFPSPRWMWLRTGCATLMTTVILLTMTLSGQSQRVWKSKYIRFKTKQLFSILKCLMKCIQ